MVQQAQCWTFSQTRTWNGDKWVWRGTQCLTGAFSPVSCMFVCKERRPDAQICCSGLQSCSDSQQLFGDNILHCRPLGNQQNWWMNVDLLKELELKEQDGRSDLSLFIKRPSAACLLKLLGKWITRKKDIKKWLQVHNRSEWKVYLFCWIVDHVLQFSIGASAAFCSCKC